MPKTPSEQLKLRVFVSYSRKDAAIAQQLVDGLMVGDFEPFLDKNDIAGGEDWKMRLGNLIDAADTVVFVISPDSVASEACRREYEHALELNKRLVPIVWRSVDASLVPPPLQRLNYIYFDRIEHFGSSLLALAKALKEDVGWVRETTRILEAAMRWDSRGRDEALLFRGKELSASSEVLKAQPKFAQMPPMLCHEFLAASEDAETKRQSAERKRLRREVRLSRATTALAGVIIVATIAIANHAWIQEQLQWRVNMRPQVLSADDERIKAANPLSSFTECKTGCPEMVVVPAGSFAMSTPSPAQMEKDDDWLKYEGPPRPTTIGKPFAIGKFPVTFDEWDACSRAGQCVVASDSGWGRGDRPVINITWDQARAYAEWLSRMTGKKYRLPTEIEWEYAARGGSSSAYGFADDAKAIDDYVWYRAISDERTHPVHSKKPNGYRLHHMIGNVWEWVQNCLDVSARPPSNPDASDGRMAGRRCVIRGAAFNDTPETMTLDIRDRDDPAEVHSTTGFRIARTLGP